MTPIFRYGSAPSQLAELHLPGGEGSYPVVVLIHGGFWRAEYGRDLMEPIARDLARRGYAAWNIEYRRTGEPGGGWPGTLADAAAALDLLAVAAAEHPLDLDRVVTLGHSAGGQLALWLAARPGLPPDAPGAAPQVRPGAAVAMAGIADLAAADAAGLNAGAVAVLLGGGADDVPERYAVASPLARLPLGVPQLLVHGAADRVVPVDQSRAYAESASAAGDVVELLEFAETGHFKVLDASNAPWRAVVERLPALIGAGEPGPHRAGMPEAPGRFGTS